MPSRRPGPATSGERRVDGDPGRLLLGVRAAHARRGGIDRGSPPGLRGPRRPAPRGRRGDRTTAALAGSISDAVRGSSAPSSGVGMGRGGRRCVTGRGRGVPGARDRRDARRRPRLPRDAARRPGRRRQRDPADRASPEARLGPPLRGDPPGARTRRGAPPRDDQRPEPRCDRRLLRRGRDPHVAGASGDVAADGRARGLRARSRCGSSTRTIAGERRTWRSGRSRRRRDADRGRRRRPGARRGDRPGAPERDGRRDGRPRPGGLLGGDGVSRLPADARSLRERLDAFTYQMRADQQQAVPVGETFLGSAAGWKRGLKQFVWRLTRFSTMRYDRLLAELAEMNGELARRLVATEEELARLRARARGSRR